MTTDDRPTSTAANADGPTMPIAVRRIAVTLASAAAVLSLAGPAAASKKYPFGSEKTYAGVRWDYPQAPSIGATATLQMNGGVSGDRVSGGHVAQLLWVNTNNPLSKNNTRNGFAGANAVPYLTAGISENRAGALRLAVFVAQRNIRGEYYETYMPRAVQRGER